MCFPHLVNSFKSRLTHALKSRAFIKVAFFLDGDLAYSMHSLQFSLISSNIFLCELLTLDENFKFSHKLFL